MNRKGAASQSKPAGGHTNGRGTGAGAVTDVDVDATVGTGIVEVGAREVAGCVDVAAEELDDASTDVDGVLDGDAVVLRLDGGASDPQESATTPTTTSAAIRGLLMVRQITEFFITVEFDAVDMPLVPFSGS